MILKTESLAVTPEARKPNNFYITPQPACPIRSPQKSYVFITRKIRFGCKYPKHILFSFENGVAGSDA